jgi:hypothetical protein
MPEVHIWPTLVGVVAVTPDAFGFSFCGTAAEKAKLRADLESGVPMAQAVGFSGSHCSLAKLVRVESKVGSPTIFVVARDPLGKSKEDFTFMQNADREAFYETALHLLGPGWKCEEASRGSCLLTLLPIGGALFGLFNIFCGALLLSVPPNPNPKPGVQPMPEGVMWGIIGFGLVMTLVCVAATFWARKIGRTTWETICAR